MTAKDLSREYPRSPFEMIQGFYWLPRLIDKVRAKQAGTLGVYTPYPCGADKRFLAHFGIETEALEAFINTGAADPEIARWCLECAERKPAEVGPEFLRKLLGPVAEDRREYFNEALADIKRERPDLDFSAATSFNRMICIEEGYPIPELPAFA
jgi:hypothetical protein